MHRLWLCAIVLLFFDGGASAYLLTTNSAGLLADFSSSSNRSASSWQLLCSSGMCGDCYKLDSGRLYLAAADERCRLCGDDVQLRVRGNFSGTQDAIRTLVSIDAPLTIVHRRNRCRMRQCLAERKQKALSLTPCMREHGRRRRRLRARRNDAARSHKVKFRVANAAAADLLRLGVPLDCTDLDRRRRRRALLPGASIRAALPSSIGPHCAIVSVRSDTSAVEFAPDFALIVRKPCAALSGGNYLVVPAHVHYECSGDDSSRGAVSTIRRKQRLEIHIAVEETSNRHGRHAIRHARRRRRRSGTWTQQHLLPMPVRYANERSAAAATTEQENRDRRDAIARQLANNNNRDKRGGGGGADRFRSVTGGGDLFRFEQTVYTVDMPEENLVPTAVTQVALVQPAAVAAPASGQSRPSNVRFSMSAVVDSRSQPMFSIDPTSGAIIARVSLDREFLDTHYFRLLAVSASDDAGSTRQTATTSLIVRVTDVNDHAPVFEQRHYNATLREGVSLGTRVLSVKATDRDSADNSRITYATPADSSSSSPFRVDAHSGLISTQKQLDRERRERYRMLIVASDSAAYGERKSR